MNVVHPRPADGWTEDTVPGDDGRTFWTWQRTDTGVLWVEPTVWVCEAGRGYAFGFEEQQTVAWQYADVRASLDDVRAAMARQELPALSSDESGMGLSSSVPADPSLSVTSSSGGASRGATDATPEPVGATPEPGRMWVEIRKGLTGNAYVCACSLDERVAGVPGYVEYLPAAHVAAAVAQERARCVRIVEKENVTSDSYYVEPTLDRILTAIQEPGA